MGKKNDILFGIFFQSLPLVAIVIELLEQLTIGHSVLAQYTKYLYSTWYWKLWKEPFGICFSFFFLEKQRGKGYIQAILINMRQPPNWQIKTDKQAQKHRRNKAKQWNLPLV